jgi:hypothetical protein
MIWRLIAIAAAVDTAIVLGVSVAWGASGPSPDAGDATAASLVLTTPARVIRDSGDARAARLVLRSWHAPPITVVRNAGDATAAKSRLRHSGPHKQSMVRVVREECDATAAKLAVKSGREAADPRPH